MAICEYCSKEFINVSNDNFCTFCRLFHDDYDLYETLDPENQTIHCRDCANWRNYHEINFNYGYCNYCLMMFAGDDGYT